MSRFESQSAHDYHGTENLGGGCRLPPRPASARRPRPDRPDRRAAGSDAAEAVIDRTVAVPDFSAAKRAEIGVAVLDPAQSASAISWNRSRHPARTGVAPADILAELAHYVDAAAVVQAIADYNAAHPSAPIAAGTPPIDAAFVEAVHQFQAKCYLEAGQVDGKAGESMLDSLGIIDRTNFNGVATVNNTAQARLTQETARVSRATGGEFTAANWYRRMMNPSFLGQRFSNGVHAILVRQLRIAERHLLSLPAYAGMTPVELGRALSINEEHKGARPAAATASMHTFGLAVDIKYRGNPWVGGNDNDPNTCDNRRFTAALRNAALLVSGVSVSGTAAALLHGLGSDPHLSTAQVYATLSQRDTDLRAYLRLADAHDSLLVPVLSARRAAGTVGVFASASETHDSAAARWRAQAAEDLGDLRATGSNFGSLRNPLDGFLNLPLDLVVTLRDRACLAWGAVDFGPGASGDMMHFDCRLLGAGAVLRNSGYAARRGHPCLRAST